MKDLTMSDALAKRIQELYALMEEEYDKVAAELNFGCSGCPDNCCDSHFLHHTYAEWAYLWRGLMELSPEQREHIEKKAAEHLRECNRAEGMGERPQVMCPLNEDGLCVLYRHRMLVCRTHGVPASMTRPDGQKLEFPGCFRCQEIVDERGEEGITVPRVERTPLLVQLVQIEDELLQHRRHMLPKVKMTIAEMIVRGAPEIPTPFCER